MVYVFSAFNVLLFFALLVALVVFCGPVCSHFGNKIEEIKKHSPDNKDELLAALDRKENRILGWGMSAIGIFFIAAIAWYIPKRMDNISFEASIVPLTNTVEAITERKMGERCAFNGVPVDAGWMEADTFPCITKGDYRIWSKGVAVMSRNNVAVRREFVIGKVGEEINRVMEIDFDAETYGIVENYPIVRTELTAAEIDALNEALK